MWGSAHCDLINTINSTCVFYHLTYGHRLRPEQQDGSVGQGMAPETDTMSSMPEPTWWKNVPTCNTFPLT